MPVSVLLLSRYNLIGYMAVPVWFMTHLVKLVPNSYLVTLLNLLKSSLVSFTIQSTHIIVLQLMRRCGC